MRVVESWGTDIPKGEVTDFYRAVAAKDGEAVCFGWIEWPDKKTRDKAMGALMSGEVQDDRVDPEKNPTPIDGKRLIFGGFETIYDKSA